MTDYFALLEQPRRPWLEPTVLQEKYHAQARVAAGTASADLNKAYQNLRDPKLRLQHLLALEDVGANENNVPNDLAELFMDVARVVRGDDVAAIQQLHERVDHLFEDSQHALQELDGRWEAGPSAPLMLEAERLFTRFSFLTRWREVIVERLFRISAG